MMWLPIRERIFDDVSIILMLHLLLLFFITLGSNKWFPRYSINGECDALVDLTLNDL